MKKIIGILSIILLSIINVSCIENRQLSEPLSNLEAKKLCGKDSMYIDIVARVIAMPAKRDMNLTYKELLKYSKYKVKLKSSESINAKALYLDSVNFELAIVEYSARIDSIIYFKTMGDNIRLKKIQIINVDDWGFNYYITFKLENCPKNITKVYFKYNYNSYVINNDNKNYAFQVGNKNSNISIFGFEENKRTYGWSSGLEYITYPEGATKIDKYRYIATRLIGVKWNNYSNIKDSIITNKLQNYNNVAYTYDNEVLVQNILNNLFN